MLRPGGSSTRRSAAPSSTRSAAADWDGGGAGSVGREGWDSFSKSTLFGGSIKPLNSNWQHSDLQETGGLRECAGIDTPADGRWTASTGVLPEEWSTASTKRPRVVLHKNDGVGLGLGWWCVIRVVVVVVVCHQGCGCGGGVSRFDDGLSGAAQGCCTRRGRQLHSYTRCRCQQRNGGGSAMVVAGWWQSDGGG
jgi:hypothetical protein